MGEFYGIQITLPINLFFKKRNSEDTNYEGRRKMWKKKGITVLREIREYCIHKTGKQNGCFKKNNIQRTTTKILGK